MKNPHYPFELLSQINTWIEKNRPKRSSEQEYVRQELLKIKKALKTLQELGVEPTQEQIAKRRDIEDRLFRFCGAEDIETLNALKDKLQETIKLLDRILRKPGARVKASSKRLRVEFDDGIVISEPTAVDTFLKALRHIGLEKCAQCENIIQLGHPVVSSKPNEYVGFQPGAIKELDGFFIETKSSTELKAKHLKEYSEELRMDVSIDIIE